MKKMRFKKRRFFALLLAVVLCIGPMDVSASAAESHESRATEETGTTETLKNGEVPVEVKAFLDAVAAIPEITSENAAEAAEYVYGPVSEAYEALLGTELMERADVQEAEAAYGAAIAAVDAALDIESEIHRVYPLTNGTWANFLADTFYSDGEPESYLYSGTYPAYVAENWTGIYDRNPASSISIKVGENGHDQRLYTHSHSCPYGHIVVEYSADYHAIMPNNARYFKNSNGEAIKDITWSLEGYEENEPGYQGFPALQVEFTGKKPGTTKLEFQTWTYYDYYDYVPSGYVIVCDYGHKCDWNGDGYADSSVGFSGWVANWETINVTVNADYVLNYDANGGTVSPTSERKTVANTTCTFNLPTPTREGYTFKGWAESTSAKNGAKGSYTLNWEEGKGSQNTPVQKTLYAVWEESKTYTVIYTDGVEGKTVFPDDGYEVKVGEATPAFGGSTDREGYTFMGWAPAVNPTVSANDANEKGEIIYTATWQANPATYTVVHEYYTNGIKDGEYRESFTDKKVGNSVKAEDIQKVYTYNNNTYSYTSANPGSLTLAVNAAQNIITLRYERTTTPSAERNIAVTKNMTELEDGTVKFDVTVENTGNVSLYNLMLVDTMDKTLEAVEDMNGVQPAVTGNGDNSEIDFMGIWGDAKAPKRENGRIVWTDKGGVTRDPNGTDKWDFTWVLNGEFKAGAKVTLTYNARIICPEDADSVEYYNYADAIAGTEEGDMPKYDGPNGISAYSFISGGSGSVGGGSGPVGGISRKYTLTYDFTGGTQNGSGSYTVEKWSSNGYYTFTVDGSVQPEKEGYTLKDGWANAKESASTTYKADAPVTATAANQHVTIYAVWEADEAKIQFDENGGSNVEDMTGTTGEEIANRSMPETTRKDYTFDGWYDNEKLTGTEVTILPDKFPAGTTTYYAKWTHNHDWHEKKNDEGNTVWADGKAPDCIHDGTAVLECSCGETKEEVKAGSKLGHDFTNAEWVDNCGDAHNGSDCTGHTQTCTRCNGTLDGGINTETHSYGEWTVTKQPTVTERGQREHICTVCGHVQKEELAALGEVTITVNFVDEKGNTIGTETKKVAKSSEYDVTEEAGKIPNGYVSNGAPTGDPVKGTADADKTVTVPVKKIVVTVTDTDEEGNKGTWTEDPDKDKVLTPNDDGKVTLPGRDDITPPDGKELDKWTDGMNEYDPGSEITPTEDVTLTPVWKDKEPEKPETITAIWKNGATDETIQAKEYPEGTSTEEIRKDDPAVPAAPEGMEFDQWVVVTEANGDVTITATYRDKEPEKPETITAIWKNGATDETIQTKEYPEGTSTEEIRKDDPAVPAAPEGMEFDQWVVVTEANGDVTITATYKDKEPETITVTWKNGETGDILKEVQDRYPKGTPAESIPASDYPAAPEVAGKNFKEWTFEVDAEGNITITATYEAKEDPTPVEPDPEKPMPTIEDVRGLIQVMVTDAGATDHGTVTYQGAQIAPESVTIGNVRDNGDGTFSCDVTISPAWYVSSYNAAHGLHSLAAGQQPKTVTLSYSALADAAAEETGETPEEEPSKVEAAEIEGGTQEAETEEGNAETADPEEGNAEAADPAEDNAEAADPAEDNAEAAAPEEDNAEAADPAEDNAEAAAPEEDNTEAADPAEDNAEAAAPEEGDAEAAAPAEGDAEAADPTEDNAEAADPAEDSAEAADPAEGDAEETSSAKENGEAADPADGNNETDDPAEDSAEAADPAGEDTQEDEGIVELAEESAAAGKWTLANPEDGTIVFTVSCAAGTVTPDPEEPTDPTEPENPGTPEQPTDPTGPENPGTPEQPTDPTEPENPGTPEQPTNPTGPVNPGTPEQPTNPANPTAPADTTPAVPAPTVVATTPAAAAPAAAAPAVPVPPTVPAQEEEEPEDVDIPEEETPQAEPETETEPEDDPIVGGLEDLAEDETPLALGEGTGRSWALLNLILTILTALASLLMLTFYFVGKRREDGDEERVRNEEEDEKLKRKGLVRLLSILPAAFAVITFILTEDMRNPMAFVDRWTLLMLLYAAVNAVLAFMAVKKWEKEEERVSKN